MVTQWHGIDGYHYNLFPEHTRFFWSPLEGKVSVSGIRDNYISSDNAKLFWHLLFFFYYFFYFFF